MCIRDRYELCLDRGLEAIEYERWRRDQARARAEGRLLGIGVAAYVERAGTGLWEAAALSVAPDGRLRWVRAIGQPFYDSNGSPMRFDGITVDVTQ